VIAPAAFGGKPTTERITVDETFPDEFLTEVCGFQVTTRARGHIAVRRFTRAGTGVVQVRTINVALTATGLFLMPGAGFEPAQAFA
jgi:hypothetical protein